MMSAGVPLVQSMEIVGRVTPTRPIGEMSLSIKAISRRRVFHTVVTTWARRTVTATFRSGPQAGRPVARSCTWRRM